MSDIGDLLELLHAADGTFGTVRARYRLWRHHERLGAAFLADARRSGGAVAQTVEPEPAPAESEEVVSIWRQPPDRARAEREDGEPSRSYGVRHGELWWSWDPTVGAVSNAENRAVGSDIGEEFATLLHPHVLVAALHLTPVGRAVRAEREVTRSARESVRALYEIRLLMITAAAGCGVMPDGSCRWALQRRGRMPRRQDLHT